MRHRTTGVIDQKFEMHGHTFHIFDVGGQRSERKKWIHCFEHVTSVLFITSLSAYDRNMFEDETMNCMTDALKLFEETVNQRWFVDSGFVILFNKFDIFKQKIKNKSLKTCFGQHQ